MKLLITGGFGYLGGRLAQFLASQSGDEIILGSRQQTEPPPWLPRAKTVQTQWDSPTGLEQICTGVDTVVHLAGVNAQDCAADPVAALEFNGVVTARLLRAAIQQEVKRFIYLSTAHVYGSPLSGTITEETCPVSLHPYATSHRVGEDAVRASHQRTEIEGVVIRLSNSFGAPAHKDANCWMLLVNDLCRQAVTTKKLLLRSSGLQRRDFITVHDVNRAVSHFLNLPVDKCSDGLFNLGGECPLRIIDMAELIAERCYALFGYKPEIIRQTRCSSEAIDDLMFSIDKLKSTGFSLRGNMESEIDQTLFFCRQHFS